VILIGDSGAGKTRLASGLCLAACKQKKRARFVAAAGLINGVLAATWQGAYSFLTCAAIPQGRIIGRSVDDAQESLDID